MTESLVFTRVEGKLPAQDVERARAFFLEKLGLSATQDDNGLLHYEVAGAQFVVFASSGAPSGTHDQLGLLVEDIEEAMAALRAKGVVFEEYEQFAALTSPTGVTDFGSVKAAWFKDSEGNVISLNELVPAQ